MRDRPSGDDPQDGDTPQPTDDGGDGGGKPADWQPTVADYMRGTSGTDYDDPVWDLPPDQVNAELARRERAKFDRVNAAIDPASAGERDDEVGEQAADRVGEDDTPESPRQWFVRRGGDFHDASRQAGQDVNAFRHLPPQPAGRVETRQPDSPDPTVTSGIDQQMHTGDLMTAAMVLVVAASKLRDQLRDGRHDAGD